MKNQLLKTITCLFFLTALFTACSKDDDGAPTTGKLTGMVTDVETQEALADVQVIIFDASTSSPSENSVTTDAEGNFTIDLTPGDYFLKFYKQGYTSVPARGIEAVSFTVEAGGTVEQTAEMSPSTVANGGFISGTITNGSAGIAGSLVVAESGTEAYSTVSDVDGNYTIYNVPAGSYNVMAYIIDYSGNAQATSVTANTETTDVDVTLTSGASGTLNGTVRNIAAGNKDVDVSLVHPITKETIPGLSTTTVAQAYTISNIPAGTYIARATYQNDERVMDPDRIAKFGEPVVVFTDNAQELVFDITNAVTLNSPTNEPTSTQPLETPSTAPTFEWTAYSSTSDYVIEVVDVATGTVIWGGFDNSGALPLKNITIPSSQTSVAYNSDGNASIAALEVGRTYRWKIYASKDDQNSTTGWTLISSSEDQLGLIKIIN